MPDIITDKEREAIAAFIAKNGVNKLKPGSSAQYGEEVLLKGRRRFTREQTKAFAARDQKVRELAAAGMTRREIAESIGVDRGLVDYMVQKMCLDVVQDKRGR